MALSTGDKVILTAATLGFAGFAYGMRPDTEEEKRAMRRLNPSDMAKGRRKGKNGYYNLTTWTPVGIDVSDLTAAAMVGNDPTGGDLVRAAERLQDLGYATSKDEPLRLHRLRSEWVEGGLMGAELRIHIESKDPILWEPPSRYNPTGSHEAVAQAVLAKHEAGERAAKARIAGLAGPAAYVDGRVKKLDSLLEKMVRKPEYADPTKLQDITGMRVIEPSIAAVKSTVARIKARFPIAAEDDYIERPKDNYRSHHLIILDDDGLQKEVQVRTPGQDEFAKWAHHVYKPPTPELKVVRDTNRETIAEYGQRMSTYYYNRDLGFLRLKEPSCPAVVAQSFGCVGRSKPMSRHNPGSCVDDWWAQ